MSNLFVVSAAPHIRTKEKTSQIMWQVSAALLPAVAASVYIFSLRSLLVIATSVVTAVVTEAVTQKLFKKGITVSDGSAVVTGVLLALTLPATVELWKVAIGAFLAIFLVKQLFGGFGYNIFNPALAARAILLSSWPQAMTTWIKPQRSFLPVDAVSSSSILGLLKEAKAPASGGGFSYLDLFLGTVPGSLGETCKIALLIGAAFLLIRKIITWRIPVTFIGSMALLSWIFGRNPLTEVLSGGLILGAFFMATDMVTTPTTGNGELLFGLGCGVLTALIRNYGGFPEGVCYSILFLNCLTPLIERLTIPRRFGMSKRQGGT